MNIELYITLYKVYNCLYTPEREDSLDYMEACKEYSR